MYMTRSRWIFIIVLTVLVLGGLVLASKSSQISVSAIDPSQILPANPKAGDTSVAIGDHVIGSPSKKVILIEYGDYQCPSCEGLYPGLKKITEAYSSQLTFVFRNFPLVTLHPNALAAATAAEAAGLQGNDAYWKMNNWLYDNQASWASSDATTRTKVFTSGVASIGLNQAAFTSDLNGDNGAGDKIRTKIKLDQALGGKANVTGTPALYLQGKAVDSTIQGDAVQGSTTLLETAIRTAITATGQTVPDTLVSSAKS